jgi:hypothetical protein
MISRMDTLVDTIMPVTNDTPIRVINTVMNAGIRYNTSPTENLRDTGERTGEEKKRGEERRGEERRGEERRGEESRIVSYRVVSCRVVWLFKMRC